MSATALPEPVRDAFRRQEKACHALGSPFTAALCALFAEQGVPAGRVNDRFREWQGQVDGGGDAVPLRLTGALHYLVLSGRDTSLASVYPPDFTTGTDMAEAVFTAIDDHDEFIDCYLDSPPQTNETGRSAILLPAFLHLRSMIDLPFVLSELGSSAGLNQNWHRFRYEYGGWQWGDPASPVTLTCEWRGGNPPDTLPVTVESCAGCDIAPVPIATADERLRLKSYVWPDQPARLDRLSGALEIAAVHPPSIATAGAADWLSERLAVSRPGRLHVVFHTIMWQYMPAAEQQNAQALIGDAGRRASKEAPLAWLRFENDGGSNGAPISLTVWNGISAEGETFTLGRGDFHGRWIDWRPMT